MLKCEVVVFKFEYLLAESVGGSVLLLIVVLWAIISTSTAEAPLANYLALASEPAVIRQRYRSIHFSIPSLGSESHIMVIGEQVAFDSTLNFYLGRNSKPSPRLLVVASRLEGRVDYVERKKILITI